jgi:hypothetical protein
MKVHHLKDLSSILVGSKGCKLRHRDFRLLSVRFSAPISRLLALYHHHHKETTMHIILVLWDCATIMARLGTMLIGVPESRKIKLCLQAHNQNLNRNANNSATTPARQNQAHAHANHVVVEDAQAASNVIIGMILVNDNNAIVLFDSEASHSFVAGNFV